MMIRRWLLGAALAIASVAPTMAADGILIPAFSPRDSVYDEVRDIVYLADSNQVIRYRLATGEMLPPVTFAAGGYVMGLDLSPDRKQLVVASGEHSDTEIWVNLVDTETLVVTQKRLPITLSNQRATWSVAFADDGSFYVTSEASQRGPQAVYRVQPGNLTATPVAYLSDSSVVAASGDGKVIGFAEPGGSPGRWGRIVNANGQTTERRVDFPMPADVFEIGMDRTGSQSAVLTYYGAHIYGADYALKGRIYDFGKQPVGVAYHPVEALAYMPFADSTQVRVYDMDDLSEVTRYDAGYQFTWPGNMSYQRGRTRLSRDGSVLMVTVIDGLRVIRMYDGLAALPLAPTTFSGQSVTFAAQGHLGIPGSFSYALLDQPAHGQASLVGNQITYTSTFGYTGTDTFRYQVHYGRAVAESVVTVTIPNRNPVVADESFAMTLPKGFAVDVLANDSDPDGQVMSITSLTGQGPGSGTIDGGRIRYTPPADAYGGTARFTYTLSDGYGGSAQGHLTVELPAFRRDPPPRIQQLPSAAMATKPRLDATLRPTVVPVQAAPRGPVAGAARVLRSWQAWIDAQIDEWLGHEQATPATAADARKQGRRH